MNLNCVRELNEEEKGCKCVTFLRAHEQKSVTTLAPRLFDEISPMHRPRRRQHPAQESRGRRSARCGVFVVAKFKESKINLKH